MPNGIDIKGIFRRRSGGIDPTAEQIKQIETAIADQPNVALQTSFIEQLAISAGTTPIESPVESPASQEFRFPTIGESTLETQAGALDITPPTAGEEASIRTQVLSEIQPLLDEIEATFAARLATEETEARGRAGETRAIGARGGILGSPRGAAQAEKTREFSAGIRRATIAEKRLAREELLLGANTRADAKIEAEKTLAKTNATEFQEFLIQQRQDARDTLANFAKSGGKIEDLNPEEIRTLLTDAGFKTQFEFENFINANQPEPDDLDFRVLKDGTVLTINKTTGDIKSNTDFKFPVEGNFSIIQLDDGTTVVLDKGTGTFEDIGTFAEAEKPELRLDPQGNLISLKLNEETGKFESEIIIRKIKSAPKETKITLDQAIKLGDPSLAGKTFEALEGLELPDEFEDAKQFIADNPNASDEELEAGIRQFAPGLEAGDISSLLATREKQTVTPEQQRTKISASVSKLKDQGFSRKEAENQIKNQIVSQTATFSDVGDIPDSIINIIKDELVTVFGRTIAQKILPKGR